MKATLALANGEVFEGTSVGASGETVFHICQHLAANGRLKRAESPTPFAVKYSLQ